MAGILGVSNLLLLNFNHPAPAGQRKGLPVNDNPTEDGWRKVDPGFPKPAKPKEDDPRAKQEADRKIWRSFGN